MSTSSSLVPFNRSHHSTRRFTNSNRSKISSHNSVFSPNITQSLDINNNSNSSNTVFVHYEHGHADSLLETLNDLRLNRHLCDVTIIVDKHEYPCHKVKLMKQYESILTLFCRIFSLLQVRIFVRCLQHLK